MSSPLTPKPPIHRDLMKDFAGDWTDAEPLEFPPFNSALVRLQCNILFKKKGLVSRFYRLVKRRFDKSYELNKDKALRYVIIPKELTISGQDEVICLSARRDWVSDREYYMLPVGYRRLAVPKDISVEWLRYIDMALVDSFYLRLETLLKRDGLWDKVPDKLKNWIIDKRFINKL